MAPSAITPPQTPSLLATSLHSTSTSQTPSPSQQSYKSYSHLTWYVSNAKQSASYYTTRFGFHLHAYSGLETGSRALTSIVVSNGDVVFNFVSAVRSHAFRDFGKTAAGDKEDGISKEEWMTVKEVHEYVERHGDAVKDVAFEVDDVNAVFSAAVAAGAKEIKRPWVLRDKDAKADDDFVALARIATYGETTHTLVQKGKGFKGAFLPGYKDLRGVRDPIEAFLPGVSLEGCDHVVGNQDWDEMEDACDYYEKALGFHRFWSVDDKDICTEFSSLRSIVMAAPSNKIKMPINEPAPGIRQSQISEYITYNAGPGVQHIALHCTDIIATIQALKSRGVEFINVPNSYYEQLKERLGESLTGGQKEGTPMIQEDFEMLRKLGILVDYDENGYLLQLFTKHLTPRPTVFIEIIQRHNFDGFGAGNFKSLFEAIEREQAERGNL